jgi:hypothetical protein
LYRCFHPAHFTNWQSFGKYNVPKSRCLALLKAEIGKAALGKAEIGKAENRNHPVKS